MLVAIAVACLVGGVALWWLNPGLRLVGLVLIVVGLALVAVVALGAVEPEVVE